MLEQVAVALRRHDAQVEAVAVVRDDRRLRRPLRGDVDDPAELREVVDQRGRVVRGRDDVEVAHGLPVAARAAGDRDLLAGRMLGEHRDDRLAAPAARGRAACAAAPRPPRARASARSTFSSRLRAHARQRAQPLRLRRLAQLLERRDPELLPDLPRALRPEPGQAHEEDDLVAGSRPCASSARGSRRPRRSGRSSPRSSCRSPAAPSRGRRRASSATGADVSRTRVRGAAVGGDAEAVVAADLREVGEQIELIGHVRVPRQRRRHPGDDMRRRCAPPSASPRTTSARTSSAWFARCTRSASHVLVIDDNSPDGTGEIADALAAELDGVVRPAPRAEGGPRPRVPRRLPPGARRRRRADPRDGLRLLARPGRRPAADRRGRGRRPRPRLALRRGRRHAELGRSFGASSRAAARSTRRCCSACRVRDLTGGFKCYRRAVLEALPLDEIHSKGYAFQIETTYRDAAQGLPRARDPDHVRRPRRGRLEDEQGDRRRGRSGRCRCCGSRRCADVLAAELAEAGAATAAAAGRRGRRARRSRRVPRPAPGRAGR